MTVAEIRALVASIDSTASHYLSTEKTKPYTAWHEYSRAPLYGDGKPAEDSWQFQVDRFTKSEDDEMVDKIFNALSADDRITVKHLVMYERDSGYIHHVFQCRAV